MVEEPGDSVLRLGRGRLPTEQEWYAEASEDLNGVEKVASLPATGRDGERAVRLRSGQNAEILAPMPSAEVVLDVVTHPG